MTRIKRSLRPILVIIMLLTGDALHGQMLPLKISADQRHFQLADGRPFFWLGDTGWLLFHKTTRQEAIRYLDTRQKQGFNVVQVMVLHSVKAKNAYGRMAVISGDVSTPDTAGADGYWAHVDYVVQEAGKRGIYLAMVPVWGGEIKGKRVTSAQAAVYAQFLAQRYGHYPNIIWLNGGDIRGTDGMEVWQTIGSTLKKHDAGQHLMGFHPRGRYSSSEWFHNAPWLDFNMYQSGHRNYAQDTSRADKYHFGENNWQFARRDYALLPTKPTLDGEPSYENIPQGLHDSLNPRWKAADVRRYAYWSVFAGGAGFTYGENAVMQFHKAGDEDGNYGVAGYWQSTILAEGATQMKYLKQLMLSKSPDGRVPADDLVAGGNGERYAHIAAMTGSNYAFAYTYTGRSFTIDATKLKFSLAKARWYNPRTGGYTSAVYKKSPEGLTFDPPGEAADGNDWVLVLEG